MTTKEWNKKGETWERSTNGVVDTRVRYVSSEDRFNVDSRGECHMWRDVPARIIRDLLGDTAPAPVKKRRGPPPADGKPYWVEYEGSPRGPQLCVRGRWIAAPSTSQAWAGNNCDHGQFADCHWPFQEPSPPTEVEPEPPEDGWWEVEHEDREVLLRHVKDGWVGTHRDSPKSMRLNWACGRYRWANATRFVPEER